MTSSSSRPPIGAVELDIASTLINEANALLRQHGEEPGNDGTGDDLPVLTEVIFDLGDDEASPSPVAPLSSPAARVRPDPVTPAAATQPARPSAPPASALRQPVPPPAPPPPLRQPAPRPQSAAPIPAAAAPTQTMQPLRLQTAGIPPLPPQTAPRVQAATPAPSVQPPKPQVGAPPPLRPTAPRVPGEVAAPAVTRPFPGVQPPRAQTNIPAQRPTPLSAQSATSATAAPRFSPQQTGAAVRPPVAPIAPVAEKSTSRLRLDLVERPDPLVADEPPPPSGVTATHMQTIAEELKSLDTLIIGEVEAWLREELPALVVREISRLNERLRTEAIAHLRTTLLPRISEHISGQVEKIKTSEEGPSSS